MRGGALTWYRSKRWWGSLSLNSDLASLSIVYYTHSRSTPHCWITRPILHMLYILLDAFPCHCMDGVSHQLPSFPLSFLEPWESTMLLFLSRIWEAFYQIGEEAFSLALSTLPFSSPEHHKEAATRYTTTEAATHTLDQTLCLLYLPNPGKRLGIPLLLPLLSFPLHHDSGWASHPIHYPDLAKERGWLTLDASLYFTRTPQIMKDAPLHHD